MSNVATGPIKYRTIPLFKGLSQSQIGIIRATGATRVFGRRETIARRNEPALAFFLVQYGCVNCSAVTDDGREILLSRLLSGDVFGLPAFLPERAYYLANATAAVETEVLCWDHHIVQHLSSAYGALAQNALAMSLYCLNLQTDRHIRVLSKSARERVAYTLGRLMTHAGRITPSGIELHINNEDLASLADVNFFTASRLLNMWERSGILQKTRGRVLIRHPHKLVAA